MNLLELVDLVDTNLAGLAFRNSTKLSPAVFVAGFLQEIIQSESFRVALRPLQGRISSILIGRAPTLLRSHWSRASCTERSYYRRP